VVRAGLKKPATGAGITDASLPHGRLLAAPNLIRPHYRIRRQLRATEYRRTNGVLIARVGLCLVARQSVVFGALVGEHRKQILLEFIGDPDEEARLALTGGPLVAAGAIDHVAEGLPVQVPPEVLGKEPPEGLRHIRVAAARDVRCQQDLG